MAAGTPPPYRPPEGHMGQWTTAQIEKHIAATGAIPPPVVPVIDDRLRDPSNAMGKFEARDDAAFAQSLGEAAVHNFHGGTENMPLRRKLLVGAAAGAMLYAAVRYEPSMANHADYPWMSFDNGFRLFGWNPEETLDRWGGVIKTIGGVILGANVLRDIPSIARGTHRLGRGGIHSAHNAGAAAKRTFVTRPAERLRNVTNAVRAVPATARRTFRPGGGTRRRP